MFASMAEEETGPPVRIGAAGEDDDSPPPTTTAILPPTTTTTMTTSSGGGGGGGNFRLHFRLPHSDHSPGATNIVRVVHHHHRLAAGGPNVAMMPMPPPSMAAAAMMPPPLEPRPMPDQTINPETTTRNSIAGGDTRRFECAICYGEPTIPSIFDVAVIL